MTRWLIALLALALTACGESGDEAKQGMDDGAPRAVYGKIPDAGKIDEGKSAPAASSAASPGYGASTQDKAPALGTGTLSHPDNLQMVMLGYRLAGEEPPLAEWAEQALKVRLANEFTRQAELQTEMDRLAAIYATTADVGRVLVRVTGTLSEYDGQAGGYYISSLSPNSMFKFEAFYQKLELQLTNSNAYFWPLDAASAQATLKKNRGLRSVGVDALFLLEGLGGDAKRRMLRGRILEYEVMSRSAGSLPILPLGHVSLQ